MQTERLVFEKLFSSQKVELALTDDLKIAYNKANDDQTKILTDLINVLDKVQALLKDNAAQWNKASILGKQLVDKSKEIGIEVPATLLNQIQISDKGAKESQTYFTKIAQLISSVSN
jgi:hypothetical protein